LLGANPIVVTSQPSADLRVWELQSPGRIGVLVGGPHDLDGDGDLEVLAGFSQSAGADPMNSILAGPSLKGSGILVLDAATGAIERTLDAERLDADPFLASLCLVEHPKLGAMLVIGCPAMPSVLGSLMQTAGALLLIDPRTGHQVRKHAGEAAAFGQAVAPAPGPGRAGVVVATSWSDSSGVTWVGVLALEESRWIWQSSYARGVSQTTVLCSLGDCNKDGYDDFAVGSRNFSTAERRSVGFVWIVSGIDGSTLLVKEGEQAFEGLGAAVAGLPDLNGDGVPDIAVTRKRRAADQEESEVLILSMPTGEQLLGLPGSWSFGHGESLAFAGFDAQRGDPLIAISSNSGVGEYARVGSVVVHSLRDGAEVGKSMGRLVTSRPIPTDKFESTLVIGSYAEGSNGKLYLRSRP